MYPLRADHSPAYPYQFSHAFALYSRSQYTIIIRSAAHSHRMKRARPHAFKQDQLINYINQSCEPLEPQPCITLPLGASIRADWEAKRRSQGITCWFRLIRDIRMYAGGFLPIGATCVQDSKCGGVLNEEI